MEVRLADSSYKESDSLEQHLYLYAGPSSLQWLIISNGETKFLGAKAWDGAGSVEAVHALIQEEEVLGFPYASIQILLSTSRLNLVPKDLYQAGDGQDFFEITDQLGIQEELQRSSISVSPYEMLFPMNRGYMLAWKIAFPQANIKLLHEVVAQKMSSGSSVWMEDNQMLIFHHQDGITQSMQVKPVHSSADFEYQLSLFFQAYPSIQLTDISLYQCGLAGYASIEEFGIRKFKWNTIPNTNRISPAHLQYFTDGSFQALFLLACE